MRPDHGGIGRRRKDREEDPVRRHRGHLRATRKSSEAAWDCRATVGNCRSMPLGMVRSATGGPRLHLAGREGDSGAGRRLQAAALSASATKPKRSLPKNISSPMKMVGEPKTPRSAASAVFASSFSALLLGPRALQQAGAVQADSVQHPRPAPAAGRDRHCGPTPRHRPPRRNRRPCPRRLRPGRRGPAGRNRCRRNEGRGEGHAMATGPARQISDGVGEFVARTPAWSDSCQTALHQIDQAERPIADRCRVLRRQPWQDGAGEIGVGLTKSKWRDRSRVGIEALSCCRRPWPAMVALPPAPAAGRIRRLRPTAATGICK